MYTSGWQEILKAFAWLTHKPETPCIINRNIMKISIKKKADERQSIKFQSAVLMCAVYVGVDVS